MMNRYIPWLLTALLAIGLIWVLAQEALPINQVGIIDMGRILSDSQYAQRLNDQMLEKYEQLIANLNVEVDRAELNETDSVEQERMIYAEYLRFRQELESDFQAALNKAIEEIAVAEKLQLVLDEDLVRYGGKDISSEVIKKLR